MKPPTWKNHRQIIQNGTTKRILNFHTHPRVPPHFTLIVSPNEVLDFQRQAWDGIEIKKEQQTQQIWNSPWHHPNGFTPPQRHISSTQLPWIPPTNDEVKKKSTKWEEENQCVHQMAVGDGTPPNGENGRILLIFIEGPPKPQQPTQHHHCAIHSIPEAMSQRNKGKYGETVTKIAKRIRQTLTCGRPVRRGG